MIAEMRTAAAEKEKEISSISLSAESTGGKIEELEKALAEKDGMIAMKEKEVRGMDTAIAAKDAEIALLNARVSEVTNHIDANSSEKEEFLVSISNLEKLLNDSKNDNTQMEKELSTHKRS